ncbi:MAG: hypothetical protein NTX33_03085 [Propionibacteriales bacterium]|nr:hypothetical protein [Propionibacteriales bacterium]
MRPITRPLASAGAALFLVLALAACGDDGGDKNADDKASDTESSQTTDESDASDPAGTDGADPSSSATLDASTKAFCDGLKDIATTVGKVKGATPTEAEWTAIQKSYEELGDIGAPDGIGDREEDGFDVVIDAVTGLSYKEAKAEFGDAGGDTIPGVSEEDNKKANEFFTYANTTCAAYLQ